MLLYQLMNVFVSLTQLVGTMHNICKVRSSNPDHHKKYQLMNMTTHTFSHTHTYIYIYIYYYNNNLCALKTQDKKPNIVIFC